MKTIRIFSLPSHQTKERTSGVDFARVIQPLKALDGFISGEYEFKVTSYDIEKHKDMDWRYVAENHDIIFFNYTAMPWEFAKMGLMARKNGRLLVMDCDDSLWDIMPDNPAHGAFGKGTQNIRNFTAICNEVDHMTTTSRYLKNVILHNTKKKPEQIGVLPNYIDLEGAYKYSGKFRNDSQIRLLHFGSTTHFIDLQNREFEEGVNMIMREYPNVVFKTVGALIPQFRYKWGPRYENSYGHQDVYKWISERFPEFMDETDIIVVPLEDNRYTRCKSYIKYLEASSASKPGVYQKIRQYEEIVKDGVNGYVAYSANDWYRAIKRLIDDVDHRRTMGEEAFKTIQDHTIQKNVSKYADFFVKIFEKGAPKWVS